MVRGERGDGEEDGKREEKGEIRNITDICPLNERRK